MICVNPDKEGAWQPVKPYKTMSANEMTTASTTAGGSFFVGGNWQWGPMSDEGSDSHGQVNYVHW